MRIRFENISKVYHPNKKVEVTALKGITLEMNSGEFVAVVGPSGSGKSTLLNLLGLIDYPSSGNIWQGDQDVALLPEKYRIGLRRTHIGYIFQFFNLIPTLTAFENVELPLWDMGSHKKQFEPHIRPLLQELGIEPLQNRFPRELSGGQQQRVAIARALVHQPALILADEPTGNLDSHTGREVISLLQSRCLKQQSACLVATHDNSLLEHFDRIIYLRDGVLEKIDEKRKAR